MQEKFKEATKRAVEVVGFDAVKTVLSRMKDGGGACRGCRCEACPGHHMEGTCEEEGWSTRDVAATGKDPFISKNATDALEYLKELEK